jgi:MATE family multidrug resistance protein
VRFNRYAEGSLRQLWFLAFPLILSSLSEMSMLFVDRLVLARYALDAHNAAVEATNLGWAFLTGWNAMASVTQIFVAQNYGAGKHQLLGRPVWQMMWLALFSMLLFLPIAIWGPPILFGAGEAQEMQRTYFFWMVLFGPMHVLFCALCGFFVGQGKTSVTGTVVVIGNILNTVLCCILVFGWEGYISPWGVKGAAIATSSAVVGQVFILAIFFFRRSNRQAYGTNRWHWSPELFKQCLTIGLPGALFGILEVAGWAVFYKMMANLGETHLTVAGIVQNILILFNFFGDGLYSAVATLSGNAIGANRPWLVFRFVRSGLILMTFFAMGFALFLWCMYPFIIEWFLGSIPDSEKTLLYTALLFGLGNAVLYKYLEGIRRVIGGALSAAADTVFLMIGGSCSIWLFMVLPVYALVVTREGSIELALALCSFYTLLAASLYAWRFYSRVWQKNSPLLVSES